MLFNFGLFGIFMSRRCEGAMRDETVLKTPLLFNATGEVKTPPPLFCLTENELHHGTTTVFLRHVIENV